MRWFWRFASPSTLLLALILFPLPWIEIQCEEFSFQNKAKQPGLSDRLTELLPKERRILYQQSGLQAAYGGWSRASDLNLEDEKEEREAAEFEAELDARMQGTGCMVLYGALLVLGLAGGLALRPSKRRSLVVGVCLSGALLVFLVQSSIGFPLEETFFRIDWKRVFPKDDPPTRRDLEEFLRHTGWYWLSLLNLLAALGLLVMELWWMRKRDVSMMRHEQ